MIVGIVVAIIVAILLALGVAAICRGLGGVGPTLADRLEDYQTPAESAGRPLSKRDRLAIKLLSVSGTDPGQRAKDLAVADVTLMVHASSTLSGAGAIGLLGLSVAQVMFGAPAPVSLVLGLAIAFGTVVASEKNLADKAHGRREEFRASLSTFIELSAVLIAGGAGVNNALTRAGSSGDNWPFLALRGRLASAAIQGVSPWAALDQLGEEFGVRELVEFGGSMSLAASSGARVTESLAAKARTARRSALSDDLAAAERSSQAMGVPVGIMTFASMVFIGYPAMATLFGSLG